MACFVMHPRVVWMPSLSIWLLVCRQSRRLQVQTGQLECVLLLTVRHVLRLS
jgi:hypothetical protein